MYSIPSILLATVIAQGPGASTDILPLRKLRLYETGVGYFERDGKVSGKTHTSLPLPASHLDDALKTLVVLSNGRKVEIGGVEFASSVSEGMGRAIAGLPLEAETELGYHDLLASLEGVEIEVRVDRERITGRLVEVLGPFTQQAPVQKRPVAAAELASDLASAYPIEPEYTLVVRTAAGALRRIRTKDTSSVRPTEASANARIEVALAALSSRSSQASQSLEVQIHGAGPLKLGYIAETPVWRTTYRVVLDADDSATLQAWALVHNDTDEDWADVSIELVNGRPTSFLFPLAAPRYTRRELAEPEVALSTVPQLLNTTSDRLWGDFIDGIGEGMIGVGGGAGASGAGYGVGGVGLVGTGRGGGGTAEATLGDLADFAQATGEESGALFVYRLPKPIDLAAHHSALVPVVQREIEAEAITWFDANNNEALMATRLVNSTDQTLPAGTVAFFDNTGFQGESGFNRLKPAEQTFAVHGVDLDVDLSRTKSRTREELRDVSYTGTRLAESLVVESQMGIVLRNRSGRARSVYVGLPVARNAELSGHDELDYDHTRNLPLARFQLQAQGSVDKQLAVKEAQSRYTERDALTAARLSELASSTVLPVNKRETLGAAAKFRTKLEANRARRGERLTRITQLEADVDRLREDLRALGSAGLKDKSTRSLSQRVVQREDELHALREANESAQRRDLRLVDALDAELAKL